MNNDYDKLIEAMKIEIQISDKSQSVLARANVDLVMPPMIVKGYTIRKNEQQNKFYASPPAVAIGRGRYFKIIWMPNELWNKLESKLVEEYKKISGNTDKEDEIDIEDIEF